MEHKGPYSTMSQPSSDKSRDPYHSSYSDHQVGVPALCTTHQSGAAGTVRGMDDDVIDTTGCCMGI